MNGQITSVTSYVTCMTKDRSLLVLYATETGNAFDIAVRIYKEGKRRGLDIRVSSADAYPLVRILDESPHSAQCPAIYRTI
jgi:sulfite reductase alpha subunit-like flavoprotein